MPRKKKIEEVKVEEKLNEVEKPVDYGTGWTGKNNMIQEYFREEKKNE